jgi:energy-coupling factor transporter ATP-binding protein EcfA2
MLKRLNVTFDRLERFTEPVSVDLSRNLCTFVGPNGSGKSTILEAVAEVLAFLNRYFIEGNGEEVRKAIKPKRTSAPDWTEARVEVEFDSPIHVPEGLRATFGDTLTGATILVAKRVDHTGRWSIANLTANKATLAFELTGQLIVDNRRRSEIERELTDLGTAATYETAKVHELNQRANQGDTSAQQQQAAVNAKHQANAIEFGIRRDALHSEHAIAANSALRLTDNGEVAKSDIEALCTSMNFPEVVYLDGASDLHKTVNEFIQRLKTLKKPKLLRKARIPTSASTEPYSRVAQHGHNVR